MFAPSTVALSAMILVCSVYNIQCEKWLDNIPNYCFINNQAHEFFVNEQEKYLDIHACIAVIEKCEVYHKLVLKKKAMSPTSVTNTK